MGSDYSVDNIHILEGGLFLSREQLLGAFVEFLKDKAEPVLWEKIALSMWTREESMSTYLENGLAVPHARVEGVEHLSLIASYVPGGVPWPDQESLAELAIFIYLPASQVTAYLQTMRKLLIWHQSVPPEERPLRWSDPERLGKEIFNALK